MIVATDRNGLIGNQGDLPWKLPADMAHFKARTMGRPIIMGRMTWESIGKPLPGRPNVVISSTMKAMGGVIVVQSLEQAIDAVPDAEEVMVIGGGQIYKAAIPLADEIELTQIDAAFEGDTWFPELEAETWVEAKRITNQPDDKNAWPYAFLTYRRR